VSETNTSAVQFWSQLLKILLVGLRNSAMLGIVKGSLDELVFDHSTGTSPYSPHFLISLLTESLMAIVVTQVRLIVCPTRPRLR
jgi:hypothetical protein